jgi:hypothetical protein
MDRRRFIGYCACTALSPLAACNDSSNPRTTSQCVAASAQNNGCALLPDGFGVGVGCDQMVSSSGSSAYDSLIANEFFSQRSFFGLPAVSLKYINDCEPNAYADPQSKSILLGINLIVKTLTAYQQQPGSFFTLLPLYAVLAHEFGHQVQFANGWSNQCDGVYQEELEADMWAGYYVGRRGLSSGFQVLQTMEQFYNFGNYQFFSPLFHGTPFQRANAFLDGILITDEISKGKLSPALDQVRARMVELLAVELKYPTDASPNLVTQSDVRHVCEQNKVPGPIEDCAASMGWDWNTLLPI